MKRNLLILLGMLMTTHVSGVEARAPAVLQFAGETLDQWHGFTRHNFTVDGCPAWVVEPKHALPGKPWSWCMEFPDAFTERCAAPQLLAAGFHHVHIKVGNTFGSPAALRHFDAFYEVLTRRGWPNAARSSASAAAGFMPIAGRRNTRSG